MYLSNNYVDINIYPLTMNVMRLLSMFIWKRAQYQMTILLLLLLLLYYYVGKKGIATHVGRYELHGCISLISSVSSVVCFKVWPHFHP